MKTILIILFAVSVVFGQTKVGYSGFAVPMDRDYGNQRMHDSLAMSRPQLDNSWRMIGKPLAFKDDWKIELLKVYDLYKTECYKDCTIDTLSYSAIWELGELVNDSCSYTAKKTFIPNLQIRHKQSTFDGFMEYLRGKTK